MDSELVQRLQQQLLDLREENCNLAEKNKFLNGKFKSVTEQRDEIEKELKLLNRKNKAFSFLPGQSSREEIIKLQDENEHLNEALQKQEVDFQRHDQALRDEIGLLQKQLQMAQNGNMKKVKRSTSKSSVQSHPLDNSGDSAIDIEELEAKLVAQNEVTKNQKAKLDDAQAATKQLEAMVKQLRLEKEDAVSKLGEMTKKNEKMSEVSTKAESRKKMSDQLAKEVSDLKAKLAEAQKESKASLECSKQKHQADKEKALGELRSQLEGEKELSKTSELKVIDANRRIDQLMSEKSELEKSFRSQKQTREFIERTLDELKEEKLAAENAAETVKSELELEKVKFEAQKSEYESSVSLLRDDIAKLKEKFEREKLALEETHKKIKDQLELKVEDEIEKQRIVERKAAVTVRELKKQLSSEKKRAEKLAEKIKTVDSNQIETGDRLSVPQPPTRDETSSIGSWSLPTEFDGVTILTGNEAEAILMKNKQLQEANFQLEEQMRALQKNQIQMSEELANREEILKMRVWNTRPDAQKVPKSVNPFSEMIMNKITEYATDHTGSHEQNPQQLKQLNKKLLRMLEEEMTKNVALRKNIEDLAKR